MKTAIVDYGMGNLRSVANSVQAVGGEAVILDSPGDLAGHDRVILPGVGAFAMAMDALNESGFADALREFAGRERPFLGICLGMQLLAEEGDEFGRRVGLGLIPGKVQPMALSPGQLLPHTGWNSVTIRRPHPWLDFEDGSDFYFVHSYVFRAEESAILAVADYGGEFPAIVGRNSVMGCQFHPEKSQAPGLSILRQFLSC